jgi:hypothetical protein
MIRLIKGKAMCFVVVVASAIVVASVNVVTAVIGAVNVIVVVVVKSRTKNKSVITS